MPTPASLPALLLIAQAVFLLKCTQTYAVMHEADHSTHTLATRAWVNMLWTIYYIYTSFCLISVIRLRSSSTSVHLWCSTVKQSRLVW